MFVRHFIIIIFIVIIITKHHLCLQKENLCPFEHFYIHLTLTQHKPSCIENGTAVHDQSTVYLTFQRSGF